MPDVDRLNVALPSIADMVAMTHAERLALQGRLDALADEVAEARGALRALLHEPPPPPALLDAKEAARRLGVSVDYVRDHGAALGIEVWLDGVARYDPLRVEALRLRRRPSPEDPGRTRLKGIA